MASDHVQVTINGREIARELAKAAPFPWPVVNPTPEEDVQCSPDDRHYSTSDRLDEVERRLRRLESLPGVAEAIAANDAREIEEKERELRKL